MGVMKIIYLSCPPLVTSTLLLERTTDEQSLWGIIVLSSGHVIEIDTMQYYYCWYGRWSRKHHWLAPWGNNYKMLWHFLILSQSTINGFGVDGAKKNFNRISSFKGWALRIQIDILKDDNLWCSLWMVKVIINVGFCFYTLSL